jgi:hypothetical protein
MHSSSSGRSSPASPDDDTDSTSSKRQLPQGARTILKDWLMSPEHFYNPYPTTEEKTDLIEKTGIEMKQLTNWFTNARKRIWKPLLTSGNTLEGQSSPRTAKKSPGGQRGGTVAQREPPRLTCRAPALKDPMDIASPHQFDNPQQADPHASHLREQWLEHPAAAAPAQPRTPGACSYQPPSHVADVHASLNAAFSADGSDFAIFEDFLVDIEFDCRPLAAPSTPPLTVAGEPADAPSPFQPAAKRQAGECGHLQRGGVTKRANVGLAWDLNADLMLSAAPTSLFA